MRCSYCNQEIPEGMYNCPSCGEEVVLDSYSDKESEDCGQDVDEMSEENSKNKKKSKKEWAAVTKVNNTEKKKDKARIIIVILLFLFPLVGIIAFLLTRKKKPHASKVYGICTLIAIVGNITIGTLMFMSGFLSVSSLDKPSVKNEASVDSDEEWEYDKVYIGKKTVMLPCSYEKFASSTGYKLTEKEASKKVEKSSVDSYILKNEDGFSIQADIMNWTNSEKTVQEGYITKICQNDTMVSKKSEKEDLVTFPGELTVGATLTENKIKELLGEPTESFVYEDNGYDYLTMAYCQSKTLTNVNCYTICMVNGKVTELAVDAQE